MDDSLRSRREDTWDLLVVKGLDYRKVVRRVSNKYGSPESTIESDISNMDSWLPDLDHTNFSSGVSRLRELRENRQRRQQMVLEARSEGDTERERALLQEIDWAIEKDVRLSQSLGETHSEGASLDDMLRALRDGDSSKRVPDPDGES
jgi:predicted  nucleic acid-binding Zn-ribbon protein